MGAIHNEHFYVINTEIILSVLVVLLWVIRGPFSESDGKSFTVTSWFIVPFPAFHPKTGLDILQVQPVSKAQARQRTGRAGRETSGVCYRLYTEEQFDELKEMTMPEIQRCNLASVVLQLMALGILDVLHFDFLDSPSQDAIENALEQLVVLGAVRKGNSGFEVKLL